MKWERTWRADPRGRAIADRHYNRRSVGAVDFVPPGQCVVLITPGADALWVTSWQLPEYSTHAWPGAWINSTFRNESPARASELILEAVAATRYVFGDPPAEGLVSFVDPKEVPPTRRRGRDIFGYCYLMAGFEHVGFTKDRNLWAWQLRPDRMPRAEAPGGQLTLQASL